MATAPKPNEADFHIAAICALYIEGREVERMFDEQYLHLDESVSLGNNTYAVSSGRIGDQNIVLLWMSEKGKTDATRAAQALKTTYGNIRLWFVVGICGGVPKIQDAAGNEAEVVLGDVIISTEILKHDERTTYDSYFEIASPPVKLSPEVTSFMKPRLAGGRHKDLKDRLHELLKPETHLDKVPQYPGVDKDHLYDSKYHHKHHKDCHKCKERGVCADALDDDCTVLGCGTAELVERDRLKSQGPQSRAIHFGTVASGHTVMKSGKERDFIANMRKYRRNIVAFEMESAGICEDGLDVIVIKSVCDYADSHKRKDWQQYTAFVGAAAFRAFVEAWGSRKKKGLNKFVEKIQNIPQDVIQGVRIVTHGLENQQPSTPYPCQGSVGQETDSKNNVGVDGSLSVPGRPQHRRGNSSTSLRSLFRMGSQDSPTTTSLGLILHHATILSPKGDAPALQHPIKGHPPSQIPTKPSSQPPSQSHSQDSSQPHSQPHSHLPYRPPLQSSPQYGADHLIAPHSPPLDDSSQFPTSDAAGYNHQTAPQHFFHSTQVGRQPPTPPRTPPQTPPQENVVRFSTESSAGRGSSITSVDRSNFLNNAARRSSASGTTAGSSPSNQGQRKRPIMEFPLFIVACEDRDLATMEVFLEPKTIDLTSSASDGSSVLHLTLGTGVVNNDEQQPIEKAVSLLCQYGADVNAKDRFGARPLHYCAKTMNKKAAEVLLGHEARINRTDAQGLTPLNYLAEESQPDVELVRFFIRKRGKLGKNVRMSPLPTTHTRKQKLVRDLLFKYEC